MRILITGATTSLAQTLAATLRETHQVRLTDHDVLSTDLAFVESELGHDESTDSLVKDIDAIVHQAYVPRPGEDETTWLDRNSRCIYNLLLAASEAAVEHFVLLSTLDLFAPYDTDMAVSETWKPLPSCEPTILGAHLAEFTASEFCHSHALQVTIARLGHLAREAETGQEPYDPIWLDERDAAQAVGQILEKGAALRASRYSVVHIQSDSARARFTIGKAKSLLGFSPQYNFEINP